MDGCDWIGEFSDRAVHLSKCTFKAVLCHFCGMSVVKTRMEEHLNECPKRKVELYFLCLLRLVHKYFYNIGGV